MNTAGWIGLVLVCFCGFICSYTGEVLSECWTIVRQRYPDMRDRALRRPYPDMGWLTFGRCGRSGWILCQVEHF